MPVALRPRVWSERCAREEEGTSVRVCDASGRRMEDAASGSGARVAPYGVGGDLREEDGGHRL